jgi:hypothetical protein
MLDFQTSNVIVKLNKNNLHKQKKVIKSIEIYNPGRGVTEFGPTRYHLNIRKQNVILKFF